ncbi:MAG: DNA-3-methyladenine glycosylase I [Chloroflexi bacterium]|jgi:DNA-3-methyladenine glycosylase I|nr:DNA-3-methyladenine glycosylase I [Chloroflexota bacterium]MBT3669303.1 DNA-3-methyladenine glycosylase I [Chloroflexota bacterium]MBT4004213.1 DNA-3-methyladenine glycosylase I [Chloroflexota bacterium]MBT4306010.1 DNA-3-methyladenine glycosylase I [Chloroflexota bacterium]MBT4532654.1 DNA-3-methyladenine glycosylase I [Chloroflexota bacterium]
MKKRCDWGTGDPLYETYHDQEWGVPEHDDRKLFEMLILEGAQAGLSWITILKKRENYKKAFDNFDPAKVSKYDEEKIQELLGNPGIIRNKLKIRATISNAKVYFEIVEEFGSLDKYLWSFVDHKPIINHFKTMADIPAQTPLSEELSKDLKKRGFKFVGPTICYAFMQAVGMVNDHLTDCFRYDKVT